MIERGEIYLANLAKTRPVLIFQNDLLNRTITDSFYKDVTIIPLSTKLLSGSYRYAIDPRDNLEKKSEIICNAIIRYFKLIKAA